MLKRRLIQGLAIAGGIYLAACIALGIVLSNTSVRMHRMPLRQTSAIRTRIQREFDAPLQNVSITAVDGAVLRGWYIEPPKNNGQSVIILHGIGSNRISYTGFADIFLREGYSVLLPDSRDHGESGGNVSTFGILERNDVSGWVSFVRERAPHCTYLLGESMGAAIGLQATAATNQLCAVAVESPYATFREVSYEWLAHSTNTPPLLWRTAGRPAIEAAIAYTWLRYHVYLPKAEPKRAVETSTVPTLLIAGTKDRDIPMHHAQELEQACQSHCVLWTVQNAAHGGASTVAPLEFRNRVLTWFASHAD